MAIARDSAATTITATGLATSITRAHTCTGSDVLLLSSCETATITTDNITAATYNGVSFLANRIGLAQFTNGGDGNTYLYWSAEGTGSGASENCVFTCSTSDVFRAYTASYTGVDQSSPIDASATNNTDTVSGVEEATTITVTASNCWAHMITANNAGAPVAGTNATWLTTGTGGVGYGAFDSNGTIATGSFTMGWSIASTIGQGTVLCAFKPVASASGPTNLKSLDTNVKANLKSYNTNIIANVKSINTNA